MHAAEAGDVDVGGRAEEDAFAAKETKLARVVVDEIVAAQDALVAAEDDVRRGDEGKVLLEPVELGVEAGGHFHGGGGDVDLEVALQALEDPLRVWHHPKDGE